MSSTLRYALVRPKSKDGSPPVKELPPGPLPNLPTRASPRASPHKYHSLRRTPGHTPRVSPKASPRHTPKDSPRETSPHRAFPPIPEGAAEEEEGSDTEGNNASGQKAETGGLGHAAGRPAGDKANGGQSEGSDGEKPSESPQKERKVVWPESDDDEGASVSHIPPSVQALFDSVKLQTPERPFRVLSSKSANDDISNENQLVRSRSQPLDLTFEQPKHALPRSSSSTAALLSKGGVSLGSSSRESSRVPSPGTGRLYSHIPSPPGWSPETKVQLGPVGRMSPSSFGPSPSKASSQSFPLSEAVRLPPDTLLESAPRLVNGSSSGHSKSSSIDTISLSAFMQPCHPVRGNPTARAMKTLEKLGKEVMGGNKSPGEDGKGLSEEGRLVLAKLTGQGKRPKSRKGLFNFLGFSRACGCGMSPTHLPMSPLREFGKGSSDGMDRDSETDNWQARRGEPVAELQLSSIGRGRADRGQLTGSEGFRGTDSSGSPPAPLVPPKGRRRERLKAPRLRPWDSPQSGEDGDQSDLGPRGAVSSGRFETASTSSYTTAAMEFQQEGSLSSASSFAVLPATVRGGEADASSSMRTASQDNDQWDSDSIVGRSGEVWDVRSVESVNQEEREDLEEVPWENPTVVGKTDDRWLVRVVVPPNGEGWDGASEASRLEDRWEGGSVASRVDEGWDGRSVMSKGEEAWEVDTWEIRSSFSRLNSKAESRVEDPQWPVGSIGGRSQNGEGGREGKPWVANPWEGVALKGEEAAQETGAGSGDARAEELASALRREQASETDAALERGESNSYSVDSETKARLVRVDSSGCSVISFPDERLARSWTESGSIGVDGDYGGDACSAASPLAAPLGELFRMRARMTSPPSVAVESLDRIASTEPLIAMNLAQKLDQVRYPEQHKNGTASPEFSRTGASDAVDLREEMETRRKVQALPASETLPGGAREQGQHAEDYAGEAEGSPNSKGVESAADVERRSRGSGSGSGSGSDISGVTYADSMASSSTEAEEEKKVGAHSPLPADPPVAKEELQGRPKNGADRETASSVPTDEETTAGQTDPQAAETHLSLLRPAAVTVQGVSGGDAARAAALPATADEARDADERREPPAAAHFSRRRSKKFSAAGPVASAVREWEVRLEELRRERLERARSRALSWHGEAEEEDSSAGEAEGPAHAADKGLVFSEERDLIEARKYHAEKVIMSDARGKRHKRSLSLQGEGSLSRGAWAPGTAEQVRGVGEVAVALAHGEGQQADRGLERLRDGDGDGAVGPMEGQDSQAWGWFGTGEGSSEAGRGPSYEERGGVGSGELRERLAGDSRAGNGDWFEGNVMSGNEGWKGAEPAGEAARDSGPSRTLPSGSHKAASQRLLQGSEFGRAGGSGGVAAEASSDAPTSEGHLQQVWDELESSSQGASGDAVLSRTSAAALPQVGIESILARALEIHERKRRLRRTMSDGLVGLDNHFLVSVPGNAPPAGRPPAQHEPGDLPVGTTGEAQQQPPPAQPDGELSRTQSLQSSGSGSLPPRAPRSGSLQESGEPVGGRSSQRREGSRASRQHSCEGMEKKSAAAEAGAAMGSEGGIWRPASTLSIEAAAARDIAAEWTRAGGGEREGEGTAGDMDEDEDENEDENEEAEAGGHDWPRQGGEGAAEFEGEAEGGGGGSQGMEGEEGPPEASGSAPEGFGADGEDGLTLGDLGLGSLSLPAALHGELPPYPPGRLAHREFGPIAMARARVLGCRDHWSWLFMEFLEILVRGLSGDDGTGADGEVPWEIGEAGRQGVRVPLTGRLQRSESVAWSVAGARREFDWLERKFEGVAHSLQNLPEGPIPFVFTAGLACWLKYWDRSGDGPPAWADLEEAARETSWQPRIGREEETSRRAQWGLDGSIQSRLVEEALLGERLLVGTPGATDILRFVGLAAGISHWQPATAMMILLRLLDRMACFECSATGEPADAQPSSATGPASRSFVAACLNALLSACQLQGGGQGGAHRRGGSADVAAEQQGRWEPMKLAELAEVALAEGIASAKHANLLERFEEVDRLYFGLNLGPGLVAMTLAAETRNLGWILPEDLMAMARQMDAMDCSEAAFHVGLQAVETGGLDAAGFDHVIRMVFLGRGVESVNMRFARLAAAVKAAHFRSADGGASYIADFADAMLRSMGMKQEHPWAYEVTLSFVRIHSSRNRGNSMASREMDLCAQVVLSRWMAARTQAEKEGGYILRVERMEDPEQEVGWPVWVRIGRIVEQRCHMPRLLNSLRRTAILGTFEKLDEDGSCSDSASLEAFDWALDSLLKDLPESEAGLSLLDALDPPEEDIADVLLSIAERMGGHTYSRWAHADETASFVAQLLALAEEEGSLDSSQLQRAVQVGLRLWGWAMPKPQQLAVQCETEEEAREVMERAVIAMWQSVAAKGMKIDDSDA